MRNDSCGWNLKQREGEAGRERERDVAQGRKHSTCSIFCSTLFASYPLPGQTRHLCSVACRSPSLRCSLNLGARATLRPLMNMSPANAAFASACVCGPGLFHWQAGWALLADGLPKPVASAATFTFPCRLGMAFRSVDVLSDDEELQSPAALEPQMCIHSL